MWTQQSGIKHRILGMAEIGSRIHSEGMDSGCSGVLAMGVSATTTARRTQSMGGKKVA